MRNKFFKFIDSLESVDDKYLIESVKVAYDAIYESIIMTPLPNAKLTGTSENIPVEPISSNGWNTKQNADNEYFEQTLPNSVLSITDKSYIGSRIGTYPTASKTHNRANGDKHLGGNWGDSGGSNDDYAGDSGGYNLGGPTDAG